MKWLGASAVVVGGVFALLAAQACAADAESTAASSAGLPGRLDLLLRTYAEDLQIIDGGRRRAVVESGRLIYQSDYYGSSSGVGVGFDGGLYGAVRLDHGGTPRNMAHWRADGSGADDATWGYLGEYVLKAKGGASVLKYGLQTVANPFMSPYDIRALPPTFRGLSVISADVPGATLSAGSFNGVVPRGDDRVRGLSTSYAGLPFDRISYAGVDAQLDDISMSLYASRYSRLWNQYFVSASKRLNLENDFHLTGCASSYLTRSTGASNAGYIHNNASSVLLTAQKSFSSVMLGYQIINGNEFMDYTQETAGIYLGNSMGVDYNAPHERSVQLRYVFDGNRAGIPGWTVMAWIVRGFGSDASVSAAAHPDPNDSLHDLYWKNGEYARGGHSEQAVKTTYTMQNGAFRGAKIAFYVYRTRVDMQYPSKSFNDAQLMVNIPVRIF